MHDAAALGLLPVVTALVKEGHDIHALDSLGKTPRERAFEYGHQAVADYLASQEALSAPPILSVSPEPLPAALKVEPMKPTRLLARWLVPCVLLFLVFWFIFPTPYEYTRKAPDIYRVNRFTGLLEVSTAKGWRTQDELDRESQAKAEARSKALAEAEAKAQSKQKERSRGKSLPEVAFGSNDQYKANVRISYSGAELLYQVTVSPFSGSLKEAYDNPYITAALVEFQLFNEDDFLVSTIAPPRSSFVRMHESGKVRCLEAQGSRFVTEKEYDQISYFLPVWRF